MSNLLTRPAPVWRYIVQRATTHEIITRDADIVLNDEEYVLSAAGRATFVTDPVIAEELAADGDPVYGKRRTLIAAEADGEIRWRGLVTHVTTQGPKREIEVHSLPTYPYGIPYLGPVQQFENVDPAEIIRFVWQYVQSFTSPASALGVVVTGSTTVRVGSESTRLKAAAIAAYDAAVAAYNDALAARRDASAALTAARDVFSTRVSAVTAASRALTDAKKVRPKNQSLIDQRQNEYNAAVARREAQRAEVDRLEKVRDDRAATVEDRNATKSSTYKAKVAASAKAKEDGGSVDLLWWEAPDCGQTIEKLASDYGLDWFERHRWNEDRSDIITEIVIGYPRAGRRRRDLRFEEGVNITIVPSIDDDDEDYANVKVLIGAGEGAGAIRRETSADDGALRTVDVISAKDVKSTKVADRRLATALPTSLVTEEVATVTVIDSVVAPLGSWQVGDDIRIDFYSAAQQRDRKLWHRVVSWTRTGDRTATLTLKRSNAYTYGG